MARFSRSNRTLVFMGLALVALLFLGNAAPVQDRADKPAQTSVSGVRPGSPGSDPLEPRALELRRARLAGEAGRAAELFNVFFPPDRLNSPAAVLKTSAPAGADGMAAVQDDAKVLHETPADRPVIATGENEKSPSIDRRA